MSALQLIRRFRRGVWRIRYVLTQPARWYYQRKRDKAKRLPHAQ